MKPNTMLHLPRQLQVCHGSIERVEMIQLINCHRVRIQGSRRGVVLG
jgi:hypothetical protein